MITYHRAAIDSLAIAPHTPVAYNSETGSIAAVRDGIAGRGIVGWDCASVVGVPVVVIVSREISN